MLLSICIPTFNRPKSLNNCLNSIAKQNIKKNFEVCISDNCSKNDIKKIIKSYKNKFRIVYKRNKKNIGFAMNVLKVSEMAKGRFIWFLGDDDMIMENALGFLLKKISQHENKVDFFWINSAYLTADYINKFPKPFDIKLAPKKMETHSKLKENKVLKFTDLIDHKICFDFLGGFYVNCFRREKWENNLDVLNLKNMRDMKIWSNLDNTFFFIKVFFKSFKNSKAYFCAKPLSINTIGTREWGNFYPFVEIVLLPEILDYYRSQGLNFFQYIYCKNYSLRNFFNYFIKIAINGKKMGSDYINFKNHFFKNLIYPNAWLSIIYFLMRKIRFN
tara:strand:- start:12945 stop:13937 length:993 start_codon:yes stop_codon:yes gene_type:complete